MPRVYAETIKAVRREHKAPYTNYPWLSSAQMRRLEPKSGDELVRLWLESMIYHHQGTIDMAFAQQLRQLDAIRRPFGLSVLVEGILVEQRADIADDKLSQTSTDMNVRGAQSPLTKTA